MKKLFSIMCTMLLMVQFAPAQQSVYIISKSGDLAVYPAKKVSFDNNEIFTFNNYNIEEWTSGDSVSLSFSVAFKSDEYKSLTPPPEIGICISDVNDSPTRYGGSIMQRLRRGSDFEGSYSFKLHALSKGTTYYYRPYVKINDVVFYGSVQSFTKYGEKSSDTEYVVINGHKFVDLGLPSGVLWAENNIGAVMGADGGDFFAWGETEPKSNYASWTYKHGSSADNATKYNDTDGKITLEEEDDAAYVNWGAPCRMPTNADFIELDSYCDWSVVDVKNTDGRNMLSAKITSKKNGNAIYLPLAGRYIGKELDLSTAYDRGGYYFPGAGGHWSSTLYTGAQASCYDFHAYVMYIQINCGTSINETGEIRYWGYPIRPVVNSKVDTTDSTDNTDPPKINRSAQNVNFLNPAQ